jgi:hypothetical protein
MPIAKTILLVSSLALLAGCQASIPGKPEVTRTIASPPPGSDPDACWGRDATQSVYEDVKQDILVQPAQVDADGTVRQPPIYRSEVRPQVVVPGREIWFEVPCADAMTPEFISSVQRALDVRGFYSGALTGRMDARTLRAVRKYQAPQGLDSSVLSLAAARKLGLVALPRDQQIDLTATIATSPAQTLPE